jgi:hypothetical protein
MLKNYNFDDFNSTWVSTMDEIYNTMGSWDTRKGHQSWKLETL